MQTNVHATATSPRFRPVITATFGNGYESVDIAESQEAANAGHHVVVFLDERSALDLALEALKVYSHITGKTTSVSTSVG